VRLIAVAECCGDRCVMEDLVGVLTVDDQAVFRAAARAIIDATPGFRAIGEASNGLDAVKLVCKLDPELVLVDVRMPGMDGIETTRRLKLVHPRSVVVLISIEDRANVPSAATRTGAAALVRKQDLNRATLVDLWSRYGHGEGGCAPHTDPSSRTLPGPERR
jgi:DNA-binding NarL/FixJ family response regulator